MLESILNVADEYDKNFELILKQREENPLLPYIHQRQTITQ